MVVIRFNSFVLVLLFIFYQVRCSFAQTYQAMVEKAVFVDTDMPHYPSRITQNEIYEVRKTKFGGRKMVLKGVLAKKMVNEEGLDGQRHDSENSGATHFDGNCHNKREGMMLEVECKLINTKRSLHPVKVQMDGYLPFNEDYPVPIPHPPKNN